MSGNYGRLKPSTKRHNANISMAYGCEKDNNVYCYRLVDGKPRFHRVILGPGWENQPFDYKKLSCYVKSEKGEEDMASPTPTKEELLAIYQQCEGKIERVSKKIRKNWGKTKALLVEYGIIDSFGTPILQGQTPPEPEGDQPDPAQEAQEPANNSISENEITVKDVLMYELEQKEAQYTPTDNDYSDEPQRTTITRAQYGEIAGITDTARGLNEDRRDALSLYCERQDFESLLEDWAKQVFKHNRLSRERKLELIGQLLDWRAEA